MRKPLNSVIEFNPPTALWLDWNRVVRLMEYVRANFHMIVKDVPMECEVFLIASGTAHNPGPVPFLMLHTPWQATWRIPDWELMVDTIAAWCAALPQDEVERIIQVTEAPTWDELVSNGAYPLCDYYGRSPHS